MGNTVNQHLSQKLTELEQLVQQAETVSNPFQAAPLAKKVIQAQSALIAYLVKEIATIRGEMKLILNEYGEQV